MKRIIINIKSTKTEDKGFLSFFETKQDIKFDIKRIYYIYQVPEGVKRGGHAHKDLQQIMFCPYGSIEVVLDDGVKKEKILLDNPSKGLVLSHGIWREMNWKKDESVLCVAASEYYNENDYIRDYDEFLKYVEKGYWDNEDKL